VKKEELKKVIKPLVKECIHEVLLEEGLLSNVVAEVARGMQGTVITEVRSTAPAPPRENIQEQAQKAREKLHSHRQSLMDSIGTEAYNGVNLFEGTAPAPAPSAAPKAGSVDLGNPGDQGVDISSLVGGASRMWDAMK
jgi:hypothetical protein